MDPVAGAERRATYLTKLFELISKITQQTEIKAANLQPASLRITESETNVEQKSRGNA